MAEQLISIGQLVILYPNAGEDKDEVVTQCMLMVAIENIDGMIIFQYKDGSKFFLQVPYQGNLLYIPKKNKEPIMLKKSIFGKYKFPKWGN